MRKLGKGVVSVLQGKDRDNNPLFWEHMGGKTDEIAPAEEALTDKEVAEEMAESVFLYKSYNLSYCLIAITFIK